MNYSKYTIFAASDASMQERYDEIVAFIIKRLKIKIKSFDVIEVKRGEKICVITPRLTSTDINRIIKAFNRNIYFLKA